MTTVASAGSADRATINVDPNKPVDHADADLCGASRAPDFLSRTNIRGSIAFTCCATMANTIGSFATYSKSPTLVPMGWDSTHRVVLISLYGFGDRVYAFLMVSVFGVVEATTPQGF
jgi:hypothetical protein